MRLHPAIFFLLNKIVFFIFKDDVAAIAHESTSMIKSCEFGGVHEPIACQKLHSAFPKTVISPR